MAFTLFDMHVNAHEKVGTILYGESSKSTGTTSIEDQTLSSAHADDQFVGGTIYFLRSISNTATTATWFEGHYARITDYDASSGQYVFNTFHASHTSNATSGLFSSIIEYGVVTPEFNTQLMNRLANAAIRTLGPFVYTDRSLQSSANQTVYTLSTAFGRSKPFQVDIMGKAGSSADDPNWVTLHGWKMQPSTAGAGYKIIFPRYLPAGRDIRVLYEEDHPKLTASTQAIDSRIHPELATLALVEKMYEYRNSRARGAQEFDVQRWNDAKRQLAEARVRWPIWRPKRKPVVTQIERGGDSVSIGVPPYKRID